MCLRSWIFLSRQNDGTDSVEEFIREKLDGRALQYVATMYAHSRIVSAKSRNRVGTVRHSDWSFNEFNFALTELNTVTQTDKGPQ
jgi:hypothetical protein